MKFKRLQLLWKETHNTSGLAEPSEARFRAWVLLIAMLVIPPLVLVAYCKTMFPGLTNTDALDFAQIGRNLSAGRGFVTDILRPLALTHGTDPLHQPDVTHGPLFPFLLALAFGALGAKDTVAAGVSGVFYLLTIPLVYLLGVRVFNRAVGLVTALIFTFNALTLEYAASGLHITLYVFLMTALLLVMHTLAASARDRDEGGTMNLPRSQIALAAVLTGLLYLTDPIFAWVGPVIFGAVLWLASPRRLAAGLLFLVSLGVLVLPWMWRNAALTGNPVFGLRGLELWMFTKGYYPGYVAYRMTPGELIPGVDLFKAVVQKILFGIGQVIQAFPQVTASWVLAFLLPGLLFRFTDSSANAVRRIMMLCFTALLAGSILFTIQMPLFVSLIPAMLVFSVAYLLHLIQQAQLPRASVAFVTALLSVAVIFPLVSDMTLVDKTPALKEVTSARALGKMTQPDEVTLSDQPWIVAWYADRPALWVPADDAKIMTYRQQFANTRWLFLTDQAAGLSPQWQYLHGVFQQWNMADAQARQAKKTMPPVAVTGKGVPLFEALNGFTAVGAVQDTSPSTVIAALPVTAPKLSQRPGRATTRTADAAPTVPAH